MSQTTPAAPAVNHDATEPWWGLQRNITPCFGARLVQEGTRKSHERDHLQHRPQPVA